MQTDDLRGETADRAVKAARLRRLEEIEPRADLPIEHLEVDALFLRDARGRRNRRTERIDGAAGGRTEVFGLAIVGVQRGNEGNAAEPLRRGLGHGAPGEERFLEILGDDRRIPDREGRIIHERVVFAVGNDRSVDAADGGLFFAPADGGDEGVGEPVALQRERLGIEDPAVESGARGRVGHALVFAAEIDGRVEGSVLRQLRRGDIGRGRAGEDDAPAGDLLVEVHEVGPQAGEVGAGGRVDIGERGTEVDPSHRLLALRSGAALVVAVDPEIGRVEKAAAGVVAGGEFLALGEE